MSTVNGKIFPNTTFPNEIQELPTFKDLSPEYQEIYMQYISYLLQGRIIEAQAVQEQIDPESLLTANVLNTLADTIGAIQELYSNTTVYTDILHEMQSIWENKEKAIKFIGEYATFSNKHAWSASATYSKDDIVEYNGNVWLAKQVSSNKVPVSNPDYWEAIFVKGNIIRTKYYSDATNPVGLEIADGTEIMYIATSDISSADNPLYSSAWKLLSVVGVKGDNGVGFTWSGQWNASTSYNVGNLVIYNGVAYSATQSNVGMNPVTYPAYWRVEFSIDTATIPVQIEEPTNIKDNGLWFKPIE